MKLEPSKNILGRGAAVMLKTSQSVCDYCIHDVLDLSGIDCDHEVHFENCIFEHFVAANTCFTKYVRFVNCRFHECSFYGAYFLVGLEIKDCVFESRLDFQSGGHNKPGNAILIMNSEFQGFVNFFDCWYEYDIEVSGNIFQKGANLLGSPYGIPVTFDGKKTIGHNIGVLNSNLED